MSRAPGRAADTSAGTRLLICAALRSEAAVLRGATGGGRVLRTGLGPRRSSRRRNARAVGGAGALAVAGLAGGLGEVPSGGVVVAEEVRDEHGTTTLPDARSLAERLRQGGFAVWSGPVSTTDHVVTGSEKGRLAAAGSIAVDMESAVLARLAGDRLRAVVRVVVDTPAEPLLRPLTPYRAVRALLRLRRLTPLMAEWAANPEHAPAVSHRTVR